MRLSENHTALDGVSVSFHNISYFVEKRNFWGKCLKRLEILSGLSGVMPPGMNAIIGPTGSGKSSILDALAGCKNPSNLNGHILLNGKRMKTKIQRHMCGYVVQEPIVMDSLTVRENISFSAALRLPRTVTRRDRDKRVCSIIKELNLDLVADRILGSQMVRGLSGGERKRTCIGIELVTDPLVLYLDEPTTGLDSHNAGIVMKLLKRLSDNGRTIVFTIHQPKYSIYSLFDRITIIADGKMVYHGPAGETAINYFQQQGYFLERYNNPADYFMDILHGESKSMQSDSDEHEILDCKRNVRRGDVLVRSVREHLFTNWSKSSVWEECQTLLNGYINECQQNTCFTIGTESFTEGESTNRIRIHDCDSSKVDQNTPLCETGHRFENHKTLGKRQTRPQSGPTCYSYVPVVDAFHYPTSFYWQLYIVTQRSLLDKIRTYKITLSHFAIQLAIALFLGIIYLNLDKSRTAGIQNRMGLFFFTCVQLMFINSTMIEMFLKDRVLFKHETAAGFYQVSVYFLSKFVSDVLPTKTLPAFVCLSFTYFMSGLRMDIVAFLVWQLTITLLTCTASALSFAVSAMVVDFQLGSLILSIVFVVMMVTSGYLINLRTLWNWLQVVSYASILRYAMNILAINELLDMEFCSVDTYDSATNIIKNYSLIIDAYSSERWTNIEHANIVSTRAYLNSTLCMSGKQYLDSQSIIYQPSWIVWLNALGLCTIFLASNTVAYFCLRLIKKYR